MHEFAEGQPADDMRVLVINDRDSQREEFQVGWDHADASLLSAYVPPGETRVVRVPRPRGKVGMNCLVLRGDDHDVQGSELLLQLLVSRPERLRYSYHAVKHGSLCEVEVE